MMYSTREGLPPGEAGPLYQDPSGKLWIGTLGGGLCRFDGNRFSLLSEKDGLASGMIYTLGGGADGDLWVGTDRGLNHLRDGKIDQTLTTRDGLPGDDVRCLVRDGEGSLWVGTTAGLARYRDGQFSQPRGTAADLRASISAVFARRDGTVLAAAADGGLFSCNQDELTRLNDPVLGHRDIDAFYEDGKGRLWMGTLGSGLLLMEGGKVTAWTTKHGLHDDDIFGIVADEQQRLWMACSKGIFSVNVADLENLVAGKLKVLESAAFNWTDGQRTIECQSGVQPDTCKTSDGRIWYSTVRGLMVVDPKRMSRNVPVSPVRVEDVVVNGRLQLPADIRVLPPGEHNLTFRYGALSYLAPMRTTYRYRLEGFDKDWVDAGLRREAFYTNLPPGNYRFEVSARCATSPRR